MKPMKNADATQALVARSMRVAGESRVLLRNADALLEARATLIEQRDELLRDIMKAGRRMCDTAVVRTGRP